MKRWAFTMLFLGALPFSSQSIQSPSSWRVAQAPTSTDRQSASAAHANHFPTDAVPFPVRVVESPSEAADRQAREAKTDKHDTEDLDAQIRAATAAEKQVGIGLGATALSFVGMVLLIWTLFETRRTAKAAEQASKTAVDTFRIYQLSERAWIAQVMVKDAQVTGASFVDDPGILHEGRRFQICWQNAGKTPARRCRLMTIGDVAVGDDHIPTFSAPADVEQRESIILPGASVWSTDWALKQRDIARLRSGELRAYLYGRLDYVDVFEPETARHTEVCMQIVYGGERADNGQPIFHYMPIGKQNYSC